MTNGEISFAEMFALVEKQAEQRKQHDLGPLPQVHPRDLTVVPAARLELADAILEIVKKYELTSGEQLDLLMEVAGRHIRSIAKYAIRHERGSSE